MSNGRAGGTRERISMASAVDFSIFEGNPAEARVDCLIVGLFDDEEPPASLRKGGAGLSSRLRQLFTRGDLSGRLAETQLLPDLPGVRRQ